MPVSVSRLAGVWTGSARSALAMQSQGESLLFEPLSDLSPPPAAIVVTVPSSPDDGQNVRLHILRTPPLRALESPAPSASDITSRPRAPFNSDNLSPPPTFTSQSTNTSMSPFEEQLATARMPPPGADYFAARRALWWAPGSNPPSPTEPNPSRGKLETLLAEPAALEDDRVWDAGLDRVSRGLTSGAKLKHRLPLALVIKILQAGWIREGTWPKGAVAPESDGDVPVPGAKATVLPLSTATPNFTTQASTED
ncbi:hypothetical protein V8D89_005808 [Ganoderma adspersum]